MSNFGLTDSSSTTDKTRALNYVLQNLGTSFQINANTGLVTLPFGDPTAIYAYVFPYVQVAFADDILGNGLSFLPTDKSFYGVRNTKIIVEGASTYKTDYVWYNSYDLGLNTGFGTLFTLYYTVPGPGKLTLIAGLITDGLIAGYNPLPYYPAFQQYNYIDVTKATANIAASVVVTQDTTGTVLGPSVYQLPIGYTSTTDSVTSTSLFSDASYQFVTYGTTGTNTLAVDNATMNHVLNLTPQSQLPPVYATGTIAVADVTNWDPAGIGSGPPYVAFYNGSTWVKLG